MASTRACTRANIVLGNLEMTEMTTWKSNNRLAVLVCKIEVVLHNCCQMQTKAVGDSRNDFFFFTGNVQKTQCFTFDTSHELEKSAGLEAKCLLTIK